MNQNKKGMEMTMNTVIIAVLALLVLGIMIFILTKNAGGLNKSISCPSHGGKCQTSSCEDPIIYPGSSNPTLCDGGEVCCAIIPGKGKVLSKVDGKIVATALG